MIILNIFISNFPFFISAIYIRQILKIVFNYKLTFLINLKTLKKNLSAIFNIKFIFISLLISFFEILLNNLTQFEMIL